MGTVAPRRPRAVNQDAVVHYGGGIGDRTGRAAVAECSVPPLMLVVPAESAPVSVKVPVPVLVRPSKLAAIGPANVLLALLLPAVSVLAPATELKTVPAPVSPPTLALLPLRSNVPLTVALPIAAPGIDRRGACPIARRRWRLSCSGVGVRAASVNVPVPVRARLPTAAELDWLRPPMLPPNVVDVFSLTVKVVAEEFAASPSTIVDVPAPSAERRPTVGPVPVRLSVAEPDAGAIDTGPLPSGELLFDAVTLFEPRMNVPLL